MNNPNKSEIKILSGFRCLYVLIRANKFNKVFICGNICQCAAYTSPSTSTYLRGGLLIQGTLFNPIREGRMVNTTIYDEPSKLKVHTYIYFICETCTLTSCNPNPMHFLKNLLHNNIVKGRTDELISLID